MNRDDFGPSREERTPERLWGEEEEEALRLWVALARSHQTVSRVVSAKVTEYGVTRPQFAILEALYHLGPLSLGDLAEKMLVTGGNVTYVVDRLEEQGLVERTRTDGDRRVVVARLTEVGRRLLTSVFPGHVEFVRAQMEHLSREERGDLRRLLKKLGKGVAD